ncbi:MAG: hypothetical protein HY700_16455 [Gemmatimonadetes bacterium]|nr:hypothetical protein [Gemmatimonadota bacterium]
MESANLTPILNVLDSATALAMVAFSGAAIDRSSSTAPLQLAVLSLLGWGVRQGQCIHAGLAIGAASGVSPNVRSLLESLLTAQYLADSRIDVAERENRLDRYFRGVRREQVKLRSALDHYPALKKVYITELELAERERVEYQEGEKALPADKRLDGGHWSGQPEGLKSLAEAVGMGSDYAIQYRLHSGSAHGNRPWDQALFEPDKLVVIPALDKNEDSGVPLGFDALRYLTWLTAIAFEVDAVRLSGSEQEELSKLRKYLEPIEVLHSKGIIGTDPLTPLSDGAA